MKRVLILILAVVLSFSLFATVGCNPTCTAHVDANHDGACDVCDQVVRIVHNDDNHDGKCDVCSANTTYVHNDADGNGKCDACDVCMGHRDGNHDGKCDVCQGDTTFQHADGNSDGLCDGCGICMGHKDANHDGKCDYCGAATTFQHTDTNKDGLCDGCGICLKHNDGDHDGYCDICDEETDFQHEDNDGDDICDVCDVCIAHHDRNHDGDCDHCGEYLGEPVHVDENQDGICDAHELGCTYVYEWLTDLQNARDYINAMYKDEEPAADYTVTTVARIGQKVFSITWTIAVDADHAEDAYVGDIDTANNTVEIIVNEDSLVDVDYVLTGTIVDADGHEISVSFERTQPAMKMATWEEYLEYCENKSSTVFSIRGYVIGAVSTTSSSKGSLYIQDEDGHGYYAYKPSLDASITASEEALDAYFPYGTEVIVTGTGTVYGGQYEFNSGCTVRKTGNVKTDLPYENVTTAWGSAKDQGDHEKLAQFQNKLVVLENAIFTREDGKYYYFTVNGVEYNIYNTNYFLEGDVVAEILAKFEVGKSATIKGIVSCYSNLYQIYPVGTDCISNITTPELTPAQKAEFEKNNLSVESNITEAGEIALPATGATYANVAITWGLDKAYDFASIVDGKLVISKLPAEKTTIKLIANLDCEGASATAEFEVNVDGATIEWKSASDAVAIANGLELGATTNEYFYFKGIVGEIYNTEKTSLIASCF